MKNRDPIQIAHLLWLSSQLVTPIEKNTARSSCFFFQGSMAGRTKLLVRPVSFTIETNKLSLTEWAMLVQWTIQITHIMFDPRMVRFQW